MKPCARHRLLEEGKQVLRFDNSALAMFGGGKLRLHEHIVGRKLARADMGPIDGHYRISQAAARYPVVGLSPSANSTRYSLSPGTISVMIPVRPL